MLIAIRALRILLGVIAAWQVLGLFPTLGWLTHLDAVTGHMWGIAVFKVIVLAVCTAVFFWLGRLKIKYGSQKEKIGDAGIAGILLVAGIFIVIVAALVTPVSNKSAKLARSDSNSTVGDIQSGRVANAPSYDTKGWTQESTGSTDIGPWLNYDPLGTRYYRDANGVIYRVYPPGVRPNAEKANPFGLAESSIRVPAAAQPQLVQPVTTQNEAPCPRGQTRIAGQSSCIPWSAFTPVSSGSG